MIKESKKEDKQRYWYFISIRECVLCGRSHEHRERRPYPKPNDYWERHEREEYACSNHF